MELLWLCAAILVFLVIRSRFRRKKAAQVAVEVEKADDFVRWGRPSATTSVRDTRLSPSARPPSSSTSQAAVPKTRPATGARWVRRGEVVEIGGHRISGGLFYFGGSLDAGYGRTENCLVNPALTVGKQADVAGTTMSYWPSYSEIRPQARKAYLEWLASDRTSEAFSIGYVFLYFYGLERRLVIEREDVGEIVDEVRRLLQHYGSNGSFRGYATRLLEAAAVIRGLPQRRPEVSPSLKSGYEMPLEVRAYLGRKLAANEALDADDGLIWFISAAETSLRTPAIRCFDEFRALFNIRFAKRFAGGFKPALPSRKIKGLDYRAASGTFNLTLDVGEGQIPDVAGLARPLSKLSAIADDIYAELDAFSRLVGKKPDARSSVEGAALLPASFLSAPGPNPLKTAADAVRAKVRSAGLTVLRTSELLGALGFGATQPGKIPIPLLNQVASILDKVNVGFEPDRRYGGSALDRDGTVALFNAVGGGAPQSEGQAFAAARTVVDVTALAAASDGTASDGEFAPLLAELQSMPGLTDGERLRLRAHAAVAGRDTPRLQSVLKSLGGLPGAERRRIADMAVGAVLADGHVSAAEVKFIERLWKSLGLQEAEIYSALHRGGIRNDEPTAVLPEVPPSGTPIPKQGKPASSGHGFDEAKLARIISETREVSTLLAGIFQDEEPIRAAGSAHGEADASALEGLDPSHSVLLLHLLNSGSMPRGDFDAFARSKALLPDGAMDTLNEWGFDVFDEPILEGDDIVTVVPHLAGELNARMRVA